MSVTGIRQDTAGKAGYGSIRQIRQDTAGYGRIRQDTAGYGRIRQDTAGYDRIRQDTAGYGRIRVLQEYGRIRETPLDKLTLTSIRLLDDAIYVPLGRKTPIGKPGWGNMPSVVDGTLAPVPWEDLDPAMVQEIQRESSGYTLDVLKNQIRPRDAVHTAPGGDEYVVPDTVAPNSPCRVSNPALVSECGLSELPSSIHSDDETEHDAFFVQTCVEEVENAE